MKRFLFIVQGEGRGHLTQALSMAQILRRAGHELVSVVVGTAHGRPVPEFFTTQIDAPVETFHSPSLSYHPVTQALDLGVTMRDVFRYPGRYIRSIRFLNRAFRERQPDVIVNFYDVLGGMAYALTRPAAPLVCVGHQYLMLHPDFVFPKGRLLDRWLVNLNTRLTSLGAARRLALSFRPLPDRPTQRIRVVPPLLRQEVLDLGPKTGHYLLAYFNQPGLSDWLEETHRRHPEIEMRLFKPGVEQPVIRQDATLSFHRIDGSAFLEQMAHCRALVTTAGFESVCEALYLGKPTLMIPMPGHYEQACNAVDARLAGAGVAADRFDLDLLLGYLPHHDPKAGDAFRVWHSRGAALIVSALESSETPPAKPFRPQPVFSFNSLRQKMAFR
ncbi:glycosyltransferase family protein [Larkinella soli]|uniref:glycosyltransferase family protein n=1 Tax=Larkinella soli TaxID=1770527 RepID=UPI000FFC4A07|nr:glycosyltransferase family protein [Larkinella soli]